MTTPQQEVLVKFQYEYTTRDGKQVSIKPEERYLLVTQNNDHWWFVRRDENTQPFFIPAQYVTVLPPENTPIQPPDDLPNPCSDTKPSPEPPLTHEDSLHYGIMHVDVRQGASVNSSGAEEEGPYAVSPPHFPTVSSHKRGTVSSKAQPDLSEDILMLTRPSCDPSKWTLKEEQIYETIDKKDSNRSTKEGTNLVTASLPHATPTPVSTQQSSKILTDAPQGLGDKRRLVKRRVHFQQSLLSIQDEEDNDLSSVYVNLPRFRQSISSLSSVTSGDSHDPHDPLRLSSKGWEIHTDDQSGKEYYYQPSTGLSTWEYPLSPGMEADQLPASTASSPRSPGRSPSGGTSDWERVLDESSGRHYFYNPNSGQSSWEPPEELLAHSANGLRRAGPPPLPEEDYPTGEDPSPRLDAEPLTEYSLIHVQKTVIPRACLDQSAPAGWTLNVNPDGAWVFTSQYTPEQWIKSVDDHGQVYYYLRDGSRSQWNLPELPAALVQSQLGNGAPAEQDRLDNRKWRNSTGSQDEKFLVTHGRMTSDSDVYSYPETQNHVSNLKKAGILNKTRIAENGKKIRKNWAQSWTVLHEGLLTFHKDPKSTPTGTSGKSSQIGVEFSVDLKGAMIGKAPKEKSSKKNVLELKSRAGTEFLIQYDTESIITDWFKVIADTIRQLEMSENQFDDEDEASEKSSSTEREDRSASSSASEVDQKKIQSKLRKFLLKRPTLQSVKEKGYIRENVFGCHLQNLCTQEKNTVPNFVRKCIWTVEKKGLGVDGIYRVSGNLAVIQKLRFKADHVENLNLEEGNWDIHVITGALKLFFRELQEPLFPYSHFNSFVQGIKIADYINRVSYISDLVRSLPEANHDTMEALFCHLRKVIEHGEENRMTVQNVAIVFGPTLLKPEVESANFTTYMIYQNQIIEFILNEFETIFHM